MKLQELLQIAKNNKSINDLLKATGRKDITKLQRKMIVNKKGIRQTVFVKKEGEEEKPEKKSESGGWVSKFFSILGLKGKKDIKKTLKSEYEKHGIKEKFNISVNFYADHIKEYLENKEKWDKLLSGKKEKATIRKKGGKAVALKRKGKSTGSPGGKQKWNMELMKFIAGQYGGKQTSDDEKKKIDPKTVKNYQDMFSKMPDEKLKKELKDAKRYNEIERIQAIENVMADRGGDKKEKSPDKATDKVETISKEKWDRLPKDYKSVIDGQKHILKMTNKGTSLVPVNIEGEKKKEKSPDNFETMPETLTMFSGETKKINKKKLKKVEIPGLDRDVYSYKVEDDNYVLIDGKTGLAFHRDSQEDYLVDTFEQLAAKSGKGMDEAEKLIESKAKKLIKEPEKKKAKNEERTMDDAKRDFEESIKNMNIKDLEKLEKKSEKMVDDLIKERNEVLTFNPKLSDKEGDERTKKVTEINKRIKNTRDSIGSITDKLSGKRFDELKDAPDDFWDFANIDKRIARAAFRTKETFDKVKNDYKKYKSKQGKEISDTKEEKTDKSGSSNKPITYDPGKGIKLQMPKWLPDFDKENIKMAQKDFGHLISVPGGAFTFKEFAKKIKENYNTNNPKMKAIIDSLEKAAKSKTMEGEGKPKDETSFKQKQYDQHTRAIKEIEKKFKDKYGVTIGDDGTIYDEDNNIIGDYDYFMKDWYDYDIENDPQADKSLNDEYKQLLESRKIVEELKDDEELMGKKMFKAIDRLRNLVKAGEKKKIPEIQNEQKEIKKANLFSEPIIVNGLKY